MGGVELGRGTCEQDEVGFVFGSCGELQGVEICVGDAEVLCLSCIVVVREWGFWCQRSYVYLPPR